MNSPGILPGVWRNLVFLLFILGTPSFLSGQIAFVPPVPMWDTWIFEEDGAYHLFYLSDGNIGRAVSHDMIHWEALPTIMNMAQKGDWDEGGMRMTGSTVKHGDTYYMAYGSGSPGTKIGFLTSKDLMNWERHSAEPSLMPEKPYEDGDHWRDLVPVYDPEKEVWDGYLFGIHEKTNRPSVAHVRTKDFKKWDYLDPVFTSEPYTRDNEGFVYMEVPDMFRIGDKYYIVFSSVRSRKNFTSGRKDASGTWYMVGDSKEGPFSIPDEPLLFGYGHGRWDSYVGHTVLCKGERLLYHQTWGPNKLVCFSTPKQVNQNRDGTLELHYWEELGSIEEEVILKKEGLEEIRGWHELRDLPPTKDMAITCSMDLKNAPSVAVLWHTAQKTAQGVCFYRDQDRVTLGGIAGGNFNSETIRDNYLDDFQKVGLLDDEFELRILVRQHMVEVYIDNRWIFSTSMSGTPEEAGGLAFWCGKGALSVKDLQVSRLEDLPIPEIPEFVSKVPRYTFGNSLEEQEAQLKENPFIQRFEASRKAFSKDPHRPIYHFVNPEGNLNDPNGLSFWQDKWHLFYQAFPPEGPGIHWGHAVSDDLIHWRDLPYAIYTSPGEQHACSGSVLIEEDRAIAMYLGHRVGIFAATSEDPLLLNWEKVTGKPVIPDPEPEVEIAYSTYDPCIWKEGDAYYALISQGPMPENHIMRANLFKSDDLATWEYLHPFVEGDLFTQPGDDNACPYFWPIGDKYIMPFFSHKSGGQYLLGDYDKTRQKFIVSSHGRFNHGATYPAGVHAPSAFPDGKGGIITIFNLNHGGKPTPGWNQHMSLPMRLTLSDSENSEDKLRIEPAGNFESLRYDHQSISELTVPANEEIVLNDIHGNAMEIVVEIETNGAPQIEMNLLRSPGREEYTRVLFYPERGEHVLPGWERKSVISLDASMSSTAEDVLSRPPETTSFLMGEQETLKLHIFIDRSSVEIFANGKKYLANRVYPSLEESTGISFVARGKPFVVRSLDAWQMKSIWEK